MSVKSKASAAKIPVSNEDQRVSIRVICVSPPRPGDYGAEFGLQDNSTAVDWVIHRGEAEKNGDIRFECKCRIRYNPRTGKPSFLGPFVYGESAKRFLYLSWRPKGWRRGEAEPADAWVRRMKVHLSSITSEQIKSVLRSGGVLEAKILGRGRDGGPNCASVQLEGGGWTVKKR